MLPVINIYLAVIRRYDITHFVIFSRIIQLVPLLGESSEGFDFFNLGIHGFSFAAACAFSFRNLSTDYHDCKKSHNQKRRSKRLKEGS